MWPQCLNKHFDWPEALSEAARKKQHSEGCIMQRDNDSGNTNRSRLHVTLQKWPAPLLDQESLPKFSCGGSRSMQKAKDQEIQGDPVPYTRDNEGNEIAGKGK